MMAAAAANAPPPILIGVLCIDVAQKLSEIYGERVKSYIAASYVKFLEGAGARVVPIWIGKERHYYEEIMERINGILIPGGAVFFDSKYITKPDMRNDCVQSSKFIFEIATAKNDAGEFFPIWGTCLGMELLLMHSAEGVDPRQDCRRMDCALPVTFAADFQKSRLFAKLSADLEEVMRTAPFGYHYHRYCITRDDLKQFKIDFQWQVLATNRDCNGLEFVSIVEHRRYPFYGCQFHPERVCYERLDDSDPCCHSPAAISAAQYFANFFVFACSMSNQRFASYAEELRHMIWNFPLYFTGRYGAHWMQCYLFEDDVDYPNAFVGVGVLNGLLQ